MPHNRIPRSILAATVALWLGGLSFYAGIVVPIGTEIVGGMEQGFITQQVTNWLNAIGALTILALGVNTLRRRRTWAIVITWALAATLQLILLILHPLLDAQLDFALRDVHDASKFYEWHRVYLIVTAGLWLGGLSHVWLITLPSSDPISSPPK